MTTIEIILVVGLGFINLYLIFILAQLKLNNDLITGRLEQQNRLMEEALAKLDRLDRSFETDNWLLKLDRQMWEVVNLLKQIAPKIPTASDGLEDALVRLRKAGERLEDGPAKEK